MKISKVILSMFLLSVLIISCNDDDDIIEPKGDYENGLLISGEGTFGGTSGSVSFISNDFETRFGVSIRPSRLGSSPIALISSAVSFCIFFLSIVLLSEL